MRPQVPSQDGPYPLPVRGSLSPRQTLGFGTLSSSSSFARVSRIYGVSSRRSAGRSRARAPQDPAWGPVVSRGAPANQAGPRSPAQQEGGRDAAFHSSDRPGCIDSDPRRVGRGAGRLLPRADRGLRGCRAGGVRRGRRGVGRPRNHLPSIPFPWILRSSRRRLTVRRRGHVSGPWRTLHRLPASLSGARTCGVLPCAHRRLRDAAARPVRRPGWSVGRRGNVLPALALPGSLHPSRWHLTLDE
jgi:hypothetical protein